MNKLQEDALSTMTGAIVDAYKCGALGSEFPIQMGVMLANEDTGDVDLFTITLDKGFRDELKRELESVSPKDKSN